MNEHDWTGMLIGLLSVVFFLLIGVLTWIGGRVHTKLDNLYEVLGNMDAKLGTIEKDLRSDMVDIDRRVTIIETERRSNERRMTHSK